MEKKYNNHSETLPAKLRVIDTTYTIVKASKNELLEFLKQFNLPIEPVNYSGCKRTNSIEYNITDVYKKTYIHILPSKTHVF